MVDPGARSARIAAAASELPPGGALAAIVSGGGPGHRERAGLALRAARALRLVAGAVRMRIRALRLGARLRSAGLRAERIEIARPSDGYALGIGRRRIWLAPSALVLGLRADAGRSALQLALAESERALASPVEVERGRVLASGAVMVAVRADRERYLLRLGSPRGWRSVTRAADAVERLLASDPPAVVRSRLVPATARGSVGTTRWQLEPLRPGRPPRRIDSSLWPSCLEFLTALTATARGPAADADAWLGAQTRRLEPHLDAAGRRDLERLRQRLAPVLSSLPRGWGHGDFHPGNLLVANGHLGSVLDWEAAVPDSLPLLDLLHLLATSQPALRRLDHGARCTAVVWPLARGPLDRRIGAYCDATGVPSDRETLLALAHAYWLARAARDVEEPTTTTTGDEWLELNLVRPLAALRAAVAAGGRG